MSERGIERPVVETLAMVEEEVRQTPEIAGFQSYEYLVSDNNSQCEAFMAADEGNLQLDYRRLNGEELGTLAAQADHAVDMLHHLSKVDGPKAEAIFTAIRYRQAEMFLINASARMNDASLPAKERAEAAEWFRAATESLYGKPEEAVFGCIAKQYIAPQLSADYAHNPHAAKLQEELRERIGQIEYGDFEFKQNTPAAMQRFADLVHVKFDFIVDHVQPRHITNEQGEQVEQKFTPDEMVEAISGALQKVGGSNAGWVCKKVAGKEMLAVSAHQKLVEVGENREPINADELRAKIVHEVGVHSLRSINAEKHGWLSASLGQDSYLAFEEAFANKVGEVYWGKASGKLPDFRYLIAGLSYGFDGQEPRNMRDTYETMWRIIALNSQETNGAMDEAKAKRTAYGQCVRMFRGTPTDIPGLLYTKDLAYVEGRHPVAVAIELMQYPQDLELLLCGKLDVTQLDHLAIANKIMPGTQLADRLRDYYALAA